MSPHVTRTRCGPHLACRDTSKRAAASQAAGASQGCPFTLRRVRRISQLRRAARAAAQTISAAASTKTFDCKTKAPPRRSDGQNEKQRPQAPAAAQLLGGLLLAALHAFIGVLVLVLPRPAPAPPGPAATAGHHRALPPQHFGLIRAGPPMETEAVCGRDSTHDDAVLQKRRLDASIRGKEGAGRHVS